MSLEVILLGVNCYPVGYLEQGITGVSSLDLAKSYDLTFCIDKNIDKLQTTHSRATFCEHKSRPKVPLFPHTAYIFCKNPRLEFIKAAISYFPPRDDRGPVIKGIGVKIGPGCQIGYDGFGYEKDALGRQWKFPHYGGVILQQDVEIGANTCIDRGTFGYTVIGRGTKIDNLVHIAHNVKIGPDSIVVAGTVIGGGAKIGEGVWLGINSSIREGITIGDDAFVGMGAVVVKDVPAGMTVVGNPAREFGR